MPMIGHTTPARNGRWKRIGSGSATAASIQIRPNHGTELIGVPRRSSQVSIETSTPCSRKYRLGPPSPALDGTPTRQLGGRARGGERGDARAAPAERSRGGAIDRERGHFGERQVPALAPELVQAC